MWIGLSRNLVVQQIYITLSAVVSLPLLWNVWKRDRCFLVNVLQRLNFYVEVCSLRVSVLFSVHDTHKICLDPRTSKALSALLICLLRAV